LHHISGYGTKSTRNPEVRSIENLAGDSMKKILLAGTLAVLLILPAVAQDTPLVDVFGGYSYLHSDPGALPAAHTSGWEASVTYNWNDWLGLKADVDGHYCCDGQKMHDFLFGPEFTLHRGKIRPYVHALGGVSVGRSDTFSEDVWAVAIGGGVDWRVSDRMSIRVAQADWLGAHYGDEVRNNFRFSTGLVFHFGKK
jgi:opacity protein-like surface antigen